MRKESTKILCFSSRLGTSTKKRQGGVRGDSNTGPKQPGSVLEASESGSISSPLHLKLHFKATLRLGGAILRAGQWGSVSPHTQHRLRATRAGSQQLGARQGRTMNVQSTEEREGPGQQAPTGPLLSLAPGSSAFCSGGDEGEPLPDGRTEKSCKQLGFAHPHVQALLSERDHCLGDRGPEKALVVQGQCGQNTTAAARCARSLGPAPTQETLNEVLEWHWRQGGCGVLPPPGPPGHLLGPGREDLPPGARTKGLGS